MDDVKALAREFAADPDSLVFLRLGEALRRKGELDAAIAVALSGLERYPDLPSARDLYARLLLDSGQHEPARRVWESVLERDARHLAAHKGLGFLSYARGELDDALDHLEVALAGDPSDSSVVQALQLVRSVAEGGADQEVGPNVFHGLEGAEDGLLLVDGSGRLLAGPIGHKSEEISALVASLAHEAERTARMLSIGDWEWLVAESSEKNVHVTRPTPKTPLVTMRDKSVPPGRLSYLAQRANEAAREWLEGQRL